MALTKKKVAKLMRAAAPGRYPDNGPTGVRGLYLIIGGGRSANWQLRYQLAKRPHWMGLGSAWDFDLTEARERGRRERQRLADKKDPLAVRRAEQAAEAAAEAAAAADAKRKATFQQCADAYIAAHRAEWKSAKHGLQWIDALQRFVYPLIGGDDVGLIDRPAVLRVLEQPSDGTTFWLAKAKTADRVRNRIQLVLNYASARGHRPEGVNPAEWSQLKHILPSPAKVTKAKPYSAVPYADAPAVMAELDRRDGVGVKALQFAILTAARRGEIVGATWSEIDLKERLWTIPASRMKADREHRVPLSDAAIDLLKSLPTEADNPSLFIGAQQAALSDMAMTQTLRRLRPGATVHGFRSSFSDWAHETTAFSNHVIELSLAHSIGNAAEKAYRRGDMLDRRRKLMSAWAVYCRSKPVAVEADNKPIPIRRGAN